MKVHCRELCESSSSSLSLFCSKKIKRCRFAGRWVKQEFQAMDDQSAGEGGRLTPSLQHLATPPVVASKVSVAKVADSG